MTEALLSQKYGFLFDLDGVLIDSEGEYSKIWAQVNREYPSGIDNLEEVIKGCTLDKILADHIRISIFRKKLWHVFTNLRGECIMNICPERVPYCNHWQEKAFRQCLSRAVTTTKCYILTVRFRK